MAHTIAEIAAAMDAAVEGDGTLTVSGAAEPAVAGPGDLAIALGRSFLKDIAAGKALAALVLPGTDWASLGLRGVIVPKRPRLAMAGVTAALHPGDLFEPGIHPSAVIDPGAELGEGVSVGPLSVISSGARIGAGSRIGAQVFIGRDVVLGPGAAIHPGARLLARVRAGARLEVLPGAVIGSDGFSFATETPSNPERAKASGGADRLSPPESEAWHKALSLGAVVLGDDVEVGSNSTIDAGTIRPTRIGEGTKLDNLVHVGHNVEVGRHCLLCGQTGIAGSVVIGDRVVLGGQTGVGDHHRIGDDVVTGAGTMILSNIAPGSVLLGYPAQRMDRSIRAYKALRRLSRDAAPAQNAVSKDRPSD